LKPKKPNQTQTGKKPSQTGLNRFRFVFFFSKKINLIIFFYKNQTELKLITAKFFNKNKEREPKKVKRKREKGKSYPSDSNKETMAFGSCFLFHSQCTKSYKPSVINTWKKNLLPLSLESLLLSFFKHLPCQTITLWFLGHNLKRILCST